MKLSNLLLRIHQDKDNSPSFIVKKSMIYLFLKLFYFNTNSLRRTFIFAIFREWTNFYEIFWACQNSISSWCSLFQINLLIRRCANDIFCIPSINFYLTLITIAFYFMASTNEFWCVGSISIFNSWWFKTFWWCSSVLPIPFLGLKLCAIMAFHISIKLCTIALRETIWLFNNSHSILMIITSFEIC